MLHVIAGSRLHFGLMELAEEQPNRYGGLGMMIRLPGLQVRYQPHANISGRSTFPLDAQPRIAQACKVAAEALGVPDPEASDFELLQCPPLHSGLGVGTQLAATVGTLVERQFLLSHIDQELPSFPSSPRELRIHQSVARLASLSGRGKRSAIGLHGFLWGGLVQDLGYDSHSSEQSAVRPIRTSSTRVPPNWRIVVITSQCSGDMCGAEEDRLIHQASAQPNTHRSQMLELAQQCTRAAATDQFNTFAHSLERYMELAAQLFAPVQAGRYRNQEVTERVELMHRAGLAAVGQSSWGPTVFGFASSESSANTSAAQLQSLLAQHNVRILVTSPMNHGAEWLNKAVPEVQHAC